MSEELDKLKARYYALAHAVQSGVGLRIQTDLKHANPKHLRTGLNMAMCEHGALMQVLLEKGVVTEEEYYTAVMEMLEKEIESYQKWTEKNLGMKVHFA